MIDKCTESVCVCVRVHVYVYVQELQNLPRIHWCNLHESTATVHRISYCE